MAISEQLVKIRKEQGYTRKRLSSELGIPYQTITNYENGSREPGLKYIVTLSKKFGITTDYIMGVESSGVSSPETHNSSKIPEELMRLLSLLSPKGLDRAASYIRYLVASDQL